MGAGACTPAGIEATLAAVKDDELVEMMKKLPVSERERIAKALSVAGAAMSGEASTEEPKKQEPQKKPETNFTVTVVKLSGEAILHGVEVCANEQVRVLMFRVADVLDGSHRVQLFADDQELSADTYMEDSGLKDGSTVTALTKPVRMLKNHPYSGVSAELKADGSVVVLGKEQFQDQETADVQAQLTADVQDIVASDHAFAALKAGGSVVAWGNSAYGGDCSKAHTLEGVPAELVDVKSIYSDSFCFAAKKADGSIVLWGNTAYYDDGEAYKKAKAAP